MPRAAAQRSASVHLIALAVALLRERGIAADSTLQGSGLDEAGLRQPGRLVTHQQELQVLANALRLTGAPEFALEIGARMHISHYGILGYALLVSPTLRGALDTMMRFESLIGSYFLLALHEDAAGGCELRAGGYAYAEAMREPSLGLCVSSLCAMLRDVCGGMPVVERVLVAGARPAHAAACEKAFGCPVEFGADRHALVLRPECLAMPLPLADPVSHQMALEQCEAASRRMDPEDVLLERIRQRLRGGAPLAPRLDRMAAELHMSPRTLRRQLHRRGTHYQAVLDEERQRLAGDYLRQTRMAVSEVAERLGYADTASFCKAFKRWTGKPPTHWRG